MYIAKYKIIDGSIVKQSILKINIFQKIKTLEVYNFCIKQIIDLDKTLYQSVGLRISTNNAKAEIVLIFVFKHNYMFINEIQKKINTEFSNTICSITAPINSDIFDNIMNVNFSTKINYINNTNYYIDDKLVGINFTIGNFIEKMINISIERDWNFVYQLHLKPYSFKEKKELERYAKKYILKLNYDTYIPKKLKNKLDNISNNTFNMDFFIDEIFVCDKESQDFFKNLFSDEFALKLYKYGFQDLPIDSNELSENLLYTGLSSLFIDNISNIEKVFSSITNNNLETFLFKQKYINIYDKSKSNSDYITKEYDIFISYSTVNTLEAETICYELEKEDYKCWYAPRDILPGMQYPEEIIKGIKASKYFILLHSKDASVSKYVVREVTKALSLNKIIIPILLDTSKLSQNMEFLLETCQWIDASRVNLTNKIEELKNVLNKLI